MRLSLLVMLVTWCVTSRDSSGKPLNVDDTLLDIVSKALEGGADKDKAESISLVLELLAQIDLPALCQSITSESAEFSRVDDIIARAASTYGITSPATESPADRGAEDDETTRVTAANRTQEPLTQTEATAADNHKAPQLVPDADANQIFSDSQLNQAFPEDLQNLVDIYLNQMGPLSPEYTANSIYNDILYPRDQIYDYYDLSMNDNLVYDVVAAAAAAAAGPNGANKDFWLDPKDKDGKDVWSLDLKDKDGNDLFSLDALDKDAAALFFPEGLLAFSSLAKEQLGDDDKVFIKGSESLKPELELFAENLKLETTNDDQNETSTISMTTSEKPITTVSTMQPNTTQAPETTVAEEEMADEDDDDFFTTLAGLLFPTTEELSAAAAAAAEAHAEVVTSAGEFEEAENIDDNAKQAATYEPEAQKFDANETTSTSSSNFATSEAATIESSSTSSSSTESSTMMSFPEHSQEEQKVEVVERIESEEKVEAFDMIDHPYLIRRADGELRSMADPNEKKARAELFHSLKIDTTPELYDNNTAEETTTVNNNTSAETIPTIEETTSTNATSVLSTATNSTTAQSTSTANMTTSTNATATSGTTKSTNGSTTAGTSEMTTTMQVTENTTTTDIAVNTTQTESAASTYTDMNSTVSTLAPLATSEETSVDPVSNSTVEELNAAASSDAGNETSSTTNLLQTVTADSNNSSEAETSQTGDLPVPTSVAMPAQVSNASEHATSLQTATTEAATAEATTITEVKTEATTTEATTESITTTTEATTTTTTKEETTEPTTTKPETTTATTETTTTTTEETTKATSQTAFPAQKTTWIIRSTNIDNQIEKSEEMEKKSEGKDSKPTPIFSRAASSKARGVPTKDFANSVFAQWAGREIQDKWSLVGKKPRAAADPASTVIPNTEGIIETYRERFPKYKIHGHNNVDLRESHTPEPRWENKLNAKYTRASVDTSKEGFATSTSASVSTFTSDHQLKQRSARKDGSKSFPSMKYNSYPHHWSPFGPRFVVPNLGTLWGINPNPKFSHTTPMNPLHFPKFSDQSSEEHMRYSIPSSRHIDVEGENEVSYKVKDERPKVSEKDLSNLGIQQKTILSEAAASSKFVRYNGYACPGLFGYFGDVMDCRSFFICSWGVPYRFFCPSGTLWNPSENVCDWSRNVRCEPK